MCGGYSFASIVSETFIAEGSNSDAAIAISARNSGPLFELPGQQDQFPKLFAECLQALEGLRRFLPHHLGVHLADNKVTG